MSPGNTSSMQRRLPLRAQTATRKGGCSATRTLLAMFCEAVALDPLRLTAFAFAVARLAVCFSFGAMTSRVDDDTITQENYAGRGLSQSCHAIAVASKQNAMHMAINANTHKRQPASAPTSFFVTCVLLTYFRIPWHAGRASAYGGRWFAHNASFGKKSR